MNRPAEHKHGTTASATGNDPAAQRVIVIAGPTASGKSALAADLAERIGGVVINADSMQVYRGLEVLTSAPDAAMRARVPHRLFGVLDPAATCSAGEWREMAVREIRAAHAEDRVPVVVGGTGLYLRALTGGIAPMPPIPDGVRAAIRARLAEEGSVALHAELDRCDPPTASRLSPQDSQRICRALEVIEATGRPLSDWQRDRTGAADLAGAGVSTLLLMPPREVLYPACDARFCRMLEQGALDEVRRLAARGLDPALPAMKALGVPHLLRHLSGETSLEEAREAGQQATRNYVKRQITWFSRQIIADVVLKKQYHERSWDKIFPKISEILLTGRD